MGHSPACLQICSVTLSPALCDQVLGDDALLCPVETQRVWVTDGSLGSGDVSRSTPGPLLVTDRTERGTAEIMVALRLQWALRVRALA